MSLPETALLLPAPGVESLVQSIRNTHDSAAADAVPAHVTVLYPFLHPGLVDHQVTAWLARLAAGTAAFETCFESVQWFDDRVAWLAPTDPQPVLSIIHAVMAHFSLQPYNGAFAPVPHLTLGDDGPNAALRDAADDVALQLPIACAISELVLIEGVVGQPWAVRDRFPLR